MSVENGDSPEIEVKDDEEYTDKKIKQRILNARENIVNGHYDLFTKPLVEEGVTFSKRDALHSWGDLVRSYIRELSVLLNHDDIPEAEYYRDEVELGAVRFIPPDKDGYAFSRIVHDEVTGQELRHMLGLGPEVDLPKPRTVEFTGLMDLVYSDHTLSQQWVVTLNPREAMPNQETIPLVDEQPVPRHIYDTAIMASDQFLQSIGIGLDISASDYNATGEPGI